MSTAEAELGAPGLPRGLIVLLTVAAAIVAVAGMHVMAGVIGPIFLALVIVVVISPIQGALRERGAPSWLASTVLFLASFGVLAAMLLALAWAAAELAGLVTSDEYADDLASTRTDIADLLERFGVSGEELTDVLDNLDIGTVAGQVTSALSGVLGVLSALGLLAFAMVFVVMDTESFERSLGYVNRDRPAIVGALMNFAASTRSYFFVSTVFGLIVAALDVVALLLLGVPLALVWGVLSFITNYIPNIGFVIGLIPPALLALFTGGWQLAVWVVVIYSVLNVVIQSIIQPKFVGDAVGLSATLTFVSLIFWGWVIGPLGALLAVPLTLLAKALLVDIDPTTKWAAPLITLQLPAGADDSSSGTSDDESGETAT
jgi:predicted PurR-regulated permease PerM